MPEERQPCAICEALVLESTAARNNGLCGQCVKDPEWARREKRINDYIADWGDPSCSEYTSLLEATILNSLAAAINRYGRERIQAVLLYGIVHVDSPSIIIVTTENLASIHDTIWNHDGSWGDLGEQPDDELYSALCRYFCDISDDCDAMPIAADILHKIRTEELVADHTFLCIVDEGDGYDEFVEKAELFNSTKTLGLHSRWTRDPY